MPLASAKSSSDEDSGFHCTVLLERPKVTRSLFSMLVSLAVGTGVFRPYNNYLFIPRELPQVCFIECKASRSDFLRLAEERYDALANQREPLRQLVGSGKNGANSFSSGMLLHRK